MCGNFVVELTLDFLSTWWATSSVPKAVVWRSSTIIKIKAEEENGKEEKSANEHVSYHNENNYTSYLALCFYGGI